MRLVPITEPNPAGEAEAAEAEAAAEEAAEAAASETEPPGVGAKTSPDPASTAPAADAEYDVALVVVHGMGAAYKSQILLEWAEPILSRMDWMARDRIYGADDTYGVQLKASDLAGDEPIVGATVTFPKRRTTDERGRPIGPVVPVTKRVAIVEARWSEEFVPLSRSQIFRWAGPFMWRAVIRMLRLFWATMVLLPWYTLIEHPRTPRKHLALKFYTPTALVDLVRLVVGFAVYVPVAAGALLLAAVLTVVLPLISPLLLIPAVKKAAGSIIDGVAGSIGDVTAWKETPVRATAMRLVVRDAIVRAKGLVGDGDVHVFAHSQGAAVSTFTLFEEMDPHAYNVRQLTTVGAAVSLLGREGWRGRVDSYTPVANWIRRRTGDTHTVGWANHWAIWDPFSAGPIADDARRARQRWRASYFPKRAGGAEGPEEHAVHNVSQPIFDHTYYYKNTLQVVEPTIRNLLGPDLPGPPDEVAYIDNRLNVINKKALGTNMIAAVIIAVLLPGITAASAFFAGLVVTVAGWFDRVAGLFGGGSTGGDASDAGAVSSVGFLHADGYLTGWGWLIASALIAALLIWINEAICGYIERTLLWDRCPLPVRWWLALTSLPRLAYVAGAAAVVWFSLDQWFAFDGAAQIWVIAVIAIVALSAFLEARFAPVPVVVPARTTKKDVEGVRVGGEHPLTLHETRKSSTYLDVLEQRQELLEPRGLWAVTWARTFHGWPAKQEQAAAMAAARAEASTANAAGAAAAKDSATEDSRESAPTRV
ncbi:hypothetical protein [Agromyces allii]|uniref:Alpha/beta hydrolase n=1 Tax=Agromyces allii TaxID=393607 RepID=A0ABN2PZY6_9MICO|nr:hypothetical protein [Agromyces allii]